MTEISSRIKNYSEQFCLGQGLTTNTMVRVLCDGLMEK